MYSSLFQTNRKTGALANLQTGRYRFTGILEEAFLKKMQQARTLSGNPECCHTENHPAELELARFEGSERLEDTLSRWTQRICSQHDPLVLEVNNFGGIPPVTVYARVLNPGPIKEMVAELRKLDLYLTGNGNPPLEAANRYTIKLTEEVNPSQFENRLYKLGRVEFREQVRVLGLNLQIWEHRQWKTIRQFFFSV
ncbi:MAG: hypothetical protein MUE99_04230 [Chitinophagaceae bacterium]|nr:hypothetical protein [Chitinophagaceae bacterium]